MTSLVTIVDHVASLTRNYNRINHSVPVGPSPFVTPTRCCRLLLLLLLFLVIMQLPSSLCLMFLRLRQTMLLTSLPLLLLQVRRCVLVLVLVNWLLFLLLLLCGHGHPRAFGGLLLHRFSNTLFDSCISATLCPAKQPLLATFGLRSAREVVREGKGATTSTCSHWGVDDFGTEWNSAVTSRTVIVHLAKWTTPPR